MDCKERHKASDSRVPGGGTGRRGDRRAVCQPLVPAGLSRGDTFLTWGRKGQGAAVCYRLFIYLVGWAVMGDLGTF